MSEYLRFLYHTVCVSEGSDGGDSPALLTAITLKTTAKAIPPVEVLATVENPDLVARRAGFRN